jgi:hypothetical protein
VNPEFLGKTGKNPPLFAARGAVVRRFVEALCEFVSFLAPLTPSMHASRRRPKFHEASKAVEYCYRRRETGFDDLRYIIGLKREWLKTDER